MSKIDWKRNPEDVGPKDLSPVREALRGLKGWAVAGGAAVTQFAPGRFTRDIDIVCLPDVALAVVKKLEDHYHERGKSIPFAKRWELCSKVIRFERALIDVLVLRTNVATDVFPRGLPTDLSQDVPVVRKPELCLLKMLAWRGRDEADVRRLVRTMLDADIEKAAKLIAKVIGESAAEAFREIVEVERRPPF